MDIGFTEEQELLRDTARRFFESECDTQFVRQRMAEPAAVTDEFWEKLANKAGSASYTLRRKPAAGWGSSIWSY